MTACDRLRPPVTVSSPLEQNEYIDPDEEILYAAMAIVGPKIFLILPLDTCSPSRALVVERMWIARMGKKLYNTAGNMHKRKRRGAMHPIKFKLLKRAHAWEKLASRNVVKSAVSNILRS